MGYRSDIRVVTTKEGYDGLKKILGNDYAYLMPEDSVLYTHGGLVYFAIDYVKWYGEYRDVKCFMDGMKKLHEENKIPFKFARLGEEFGDFEAEEYDEEGVLPDIYPYQSFDDDYTENQMGYDIIEES